ncbi:ketopantoate reductase family protein [Paenibacillus athensensis]|uniref:Ketopantoate reductase n=1 Tax=Paenibacillus athensensis TaxID=1967502 RepID=A0A4Y8PWA8_9BACL|nr:2-dehydropantoate 2-reductase N-terminal domain-containing protein [Paenibacillus athensensis]MCD1261842.1 ketopantoate reductase family protein [Paenibacillus athensensis]
MKILFFGRGVIGTQYAWALEQAGHTVEFYVREGRKAQYGSHVTLDIRDARRRKKDRLIQQQWPIVIHEEIKENHDYDLIVMSVNPEQVSSAVKYLAPRVGPATVLFFNNYWHDPRVAVQPIPLRQMVVGFPGAGGGFEGNTLYGSLYKMVQLGTLASEPTPREIQVRKLFTEAGFTTKVQKDIQGWLRNHFALNVAMEVEVLKSGSFKQVVTSSEALAGISRNLKEMLPVLQAKGSKPDAMTRLLAALPPRWIGYLMHSFVFTPTSMAYIAVEHNHYPVGHAVKEVIADARKHGIQVPRLFAVEHLIK